MDIPIRENSRLQVAGFSNTLLPGQVVVQVWLQDEDTGAIVPNETIIDFTAAVAPTRDVSLTKGKIISATARWTGVVISDGEVFVSVRIILGLPATNVLQAVLMQGYLNADDPLAFPGSGVKRGVDGPGNYEIFSQAIGAGVDFTFIVSEGFRWRPVSLRAQLVTDANAANRIPVLEMVEGASIKASSATSNTQPASTTRIYTWFIGASRSGLIESNVEIPMPEQWLMAANLIRTATTAIQVGDQWSAIVLTVEAKSDA